MKKYVFIQLLLIAVCFSKSLKVSDKKSLVYGQIILPNVIGEKVKLYFKNEKGRTESILLGFSPKQYISYDFITYLKPGRYKLIKVEGVSGGLSYISTSTRQILKYSSEEEKQEVLQKNQEWSKKTKILGIDTGRKLEKSFVRHEFEVSPNSILNLGAIDLSAEEVFPVFKDFDVSKSEKILKKYDLDDIKEAKSVSYQ